MTTPIENPLTQGSELNRSGTADLFADSETPLPKAGRIQTSVAVSPALPAGAGWMAGMAAQAKDRPPKSPTAPNGEEEDWIWPGDQLACFNLELLARHLGSREQVLSDAPKRRLAEEFWQERLFTGVAMLDPVDTAELEKPEGFPPETLVSLHLPLILNVLGRARCGLLYPKVPLLLDRKRDLLFAYVSDDPRLVALTREFAHKRASEL